MYFSTKSVDTLRAIGKSPTTTSSSPPGRSLTAAKRQFLPILTTRRVGAAMWAFFVILSGVMVWHNLCIRSWGIGTFPSFARCEHKVDQLHTQGVEADATNERLSKKRAWHISCRQALPCAPFDAIIPWTCCTTK